MDTTSSATGAGRLMARVCCAASLALVMGTAAGAGLFSAKEIPSAWNDSTVKVDGIGGEWDTDAMTEKEGLSVAAANDGKDLYIYAVAADRSSAAQLSGAFKQTFTLWLDGKGGKKKVYGIRITAQSAKSNESEARTLPPGEQQEERKRPEARVISTVSYEADMVDAEGSIGTLETEGVEFKSGLNRKKRPVFEFRIPLAKLTAKDSTGIGIGFETSEISESAMPAKKEQGARSGGGMEGGPGGGMSGGPGGGMGGEPGGGMGGGPGGGMGGGHGGGMGGGPGGGMGGGPGGGMGGGHGAMGESAPALPDPIGFWLKIKLASK